MKTRQGVFAWDKTEETGDQEEDMATEEEIRSEVLELGRLSAEQENILYNICLKQD